MFVEQTKKDWLIAALSTNHSNSPWVGCTKALGKVAVWLTISSIRGALSLPVATKYTWWALFNTGKVNVIRSLGGLGLSRI